jgi:DNA replication and repair protein RecF
VAVLEEELRSHAERLAFPYPDLVVRLESDVPLEGDIHANLKRALQARSREEKLAQRCLVGPHRNDVSVLSGKTPLGDRASSGEARLLLLAWTLAEIGLASRKGGLQPVFAFDDFDAEWDGRVLSRFAEALPEGLQVFLTSARAESVRSLFSQDGVVLEIENGAVRGRQSMTRPAREGQGPRLVA